MIALLWPWAILASPFKSKRKLDAKNVALRHQVIVLWRQVRLQVGARLLWHGHELKYVAVRVLEIEAAATIPVIELAVIKTPGSAAVCEPSLFDALEDGIELVIANVESVVLTAE